MSFDVDTVLVLVMQPFLGKTDFTADFLVFCLWEFFLPFFYDVPGAIHVGSVMQMYFLAGRGLVSPQC